MSYLNWPRLHFSGGFKATPPTVNNEKRHFELATFDDEFQRPEGGGGDLPLGDGRCWTIARSSPPFSSTSRPSRTQSGRRYRAPKPGAPSLQTGPASGRANPDTWSRPAPTERRVSARDKARRVLHVVLRL